MIGAGEVALADGLDVQPERISLDHIYLCSYGRGSSSVSNLNTQEFQKRPGVVQKREPKRFEM
jgi:hypothetical protein